MKKILLSVCLIATSVFAFAQKPGNGDNSFTFGISGINTISLSTPHYTSTLLFRHYLNNGLAARVGLNVGTSSNSTKQAGYKGDSINNTSSKMSWALTLGIQKSFKGTDKLDTYIGADLLIGGGSSSNKNITTDVNGGTITTVDTKDGSTFKFGIIPCVGLNYYIASWLAVGAEFGWGFAATSTAAGTTTTTVDVTGGGSSSMTSKSPATSASGFGTIGSGMLTVTAAFR